MTHAEILEKAIQKAIDGGWDRFGWPNWKVWSDDTVMLYDKSQEEDETRWVRGGIELELNTIIFNHDFAKALWGEGFVDTGLLYQESVGNKQIVYQVKCWQYHLQQMVIADDRIAYLGENL